jgi:hypothetical protein
MISAADRRRRLIPVTVAAMVGLTVMGCSSQPAAVQVRAERTTTRSDVEPPSDGPATSTPIPAPSDVPIEAPIDAPPISSPTTSVAPPADLPSTPASSTSELPPALLPTTVPPNQIPPTTAPLAGCRAAIDYLARHAAPGFRFVCPGDAQGHQAMTCVNDPGTCPNQWVIVIADPSCAAAIRNEALNSWIVTRQLKAPFDAYGHC